MLKAMSRPEGIVIAAAEGLSWKVGGDGKMEGRVEGYEGDDESEEFFSVRSCFSMCSGGSGGGEGCWWEERGRFWGRKAAASAWDEWFKQCEGWPFGLWRRRPPPVVVVLPPLPRSPADSWTWHKRNLSSTAKACAVWAAT
ncbi:hypothetical protein AXF42_Ash006666 [Apostasia shenzhenica]|uniref:Uncharacterized protein n=1 Tax=Apostasia shenzhenica TaxID=1088818 RepID=A0A2I0AIS2_9ASPA|nr:hypothetical protein AXF42_Ash006666 [Apostasia shenzhenica]